MKPINTCSTEDSEATEADRWQRLAILLASRVVLRGDLDERDLRVLRDFFSELLDRRSR
jgi:hypothetical protein